MHHNDFGSQALITPEVMNIFMTAEDICITDFRKDNGVHNIS